MIKRIQKLLGESAFAHFSSLFSINYKSVGLVLTLFLSLSNTLLYSQICVDGTGNRIAGTWHSDLYIAGNTTTNSNDLYGWGQGMATMAGLTASVSSNNSTNDVYVPTLIPQSSYGGVPLEVRGSSPTSSINVFGLRTTTKFYVFGDGRGNITNWSSFGGTSLSTGDVTNKLPAGVALSDIASFRISSSAIALLTNSGNVYMLSKNSLNLLGDKSTSESTSSSAAATSSSINPSSVTNTTQFTIASKPNLSVGDQISLSNGTNSISGTVNTYNISTGVLTINKVSTSGSSSFNTWTLSYNYSWWHQVKLSDGTTPLSGVTKLSVSGSGAMALTSSGRLYYWGDGNPYGSLTTPTSYNYAYDITAATPSGTTISDVLVAGKTNSNLFLLGADGYVYSCGTNDKGILGINNSTTTTYTASFQKVKKETDGANASTLNNIKKIDAGNNGDLDIVVAMNASGQIFGWGDNNQYGMLGTIKATSGSNTDHFGAIQIFTSATAAYSKVSGGTAASTASPGSGYSDVSVGGHFIIAFYTSGNTSQYWYQGHNTNGSIGYDPDAVVQSGNTFGTQSSISSIYAPTYLNAPAGTSFSCSNAVASINVSSVALASLTTCSGSASPYTTFTVSGTGLTSSINVTAPSGFEVSTSATGTYTSSISLSATSGTVSTTTLYIRLSAGASNGASANISCSSGSVSQQVATPAVTINVCTYPTITKTGTLKTFTVCTNLTLTPQAITIAGTDLTNNINITAPTGFEISLSPSSGYSSALTLVQSSGVVTNTNIYIRTLSTNVIAGTSTLTISSTGVTSQSISLVTYGDNALSFDGTSDYVSLPVNVANGFTNFSFESWVYPTSSASWQRILDFGKSSTTGYMFLTNSFGNNNIPRFAISTTTNSGEQLVSSSTALPLNTWSHIAVVLDATAQTATLYINGQSVGTGAITITPSSLGTLTSAYIGKSFYSDPYFSGKMDEIRIWNTARTSTEIANNYQNELVGNESGLVAYYNLNQGIANGTNTGLTTVNDKTSNSYNGTLNTFALTGTSSNWIAGSLPAITAAGSATTVVSGNTLQLSNTFSGGSWSSSNTSFATVNPTTGLVSGVSPGSVVITYSACSKTATYNLSVVAPTLTVSSLKTFTSCSGCTITPQSFTVAGTNLSANVVITAPIGFELASSSGGTYSSTLSLTPSAGTLTSTNVFARLINSATSASNGNFTIVSTGAESKTATATVNTDNSLNFGGAASINIGQPISTGASYTMEAWVNYQPPVNNTSASNVISSYNNPFFISTDNKLYAGVAGAFTVVVSPTTIPTNKWTHVAVTFDNATKSMKLYVNGTQVATGTAASSFTLSGAEPLYIGSHTGAGPSFSPVSFFKGNIDEVRIWNTVRSASDIQNNMFSELTSSETNLKSYYSFNQGVIGGTNTSITSVTDGSSTGYNASIANFARTGTSNNFVAGFIPEIAGSTTVNKNSTVTLTNGLTGGSWSSSNINIATVNASTGDVTGVNAGNATITYTICGKTVSKVVTVVVPSITTSGTLNAFNTCLGTASASQTFTVSAQYLTANLVITAPAGYELATSSGGTYSSTLSIVPTSGTVSASLIYVRLSSSAVNGQYGNIAITSTSAVTQNVSTGNALVTRSVTAGVTILSDATNNTICAGSPIVFTALPTNGGNSPAYQWKLNGNNITGANSATYSSTSLANNDAISVLMTSSLSSCINGSPASSNTITTIVNSVPSTPGAISGLTTICLNSNQVYSVPSVSGATSYTWVVSGNLTATLSTTNVINVTAANTQGSGTLEVFANNACGTSIASSSVSITINNTPAPTASFTLSSNTVCLTSPSVTFSNTSTPNAGSTLTGYTWDFGDGSSQMTTANASRIYAASGIFDVVMNVTSSNNCTSAFSSRIKVDPISVAGTASVANPQICEGTSTVLTLTGHTGTIQWQKSTDGINFTNISGANTAVYNTGNLTTTSYYQAVVTSGACSSATSGVVTVTVSATPAVTLASLANINSTATSFDLTYSNAVGAPDEYSITAVGPNAMPNFVAISNYGLPVSPITVLIPASIPGVYNFNLVVTNGSLGCVSSVIPFTQTIGSASSTITVTGLTTYTYNGSGQGPVTNTKTGSTGAVTYSYSGTGSTTYGPSATLPTGVGTYQVVATLASDVNYSGATSAPYAFIINDAPSVISINRVENTPTNLSTLHFVITFSKDITGFDAGDLTLINTGTVSTTSMVVSTITSSTYTVTVSGITGNGTLGLDLKSSGTGIVDSYGAGITNGITGQVYTIDKITLTPTFNTPATNDNFVGTSLGISVNIPETNLANTIRLTFAGLSNTVLVTLNNGSGIISGNLNLNNLVASSIVASSSISTLPSDIYTVTISYQDYLGNPVASASINNFKVNYSLASTITVTGLTTYTYNGSGQGPVTNTKTGSTGAVTYSYSGTGSTTYGPSATLPTDVGTYEVTATLASDANYSGATSAPYAFTITAASSTITVTGLTTYTYNGSGQGPVTNTKTGSTGAVTYLYAGTGSTTYGPSATLPTGVGTYQVIATLVADANYSGATSAPYAFTITAASSTITVTGLTTYTYNGSGQGPATNTKTGSTGAVTYSYAGTGSTTYGPSATLPTGAGTYQVIATLAADANYIGATSAPYAFTINSSAPVDSDGDGVTDTQEIADGTDPNDGCSYLAASKTLTPSTAWNALDCDGDGTPNGTDTDPKDPCVHAAGATPVYTNAIWRAADCDGDGVTNGKEKDDNTDPNDGCSYVLASRTLTPSAAWGALDCDKDGNSNATDPHTVTPEASNDVVTVGNSGKATVNILTNDDFLPGVNTDITRQAPPNDGTAKGTVTFNPLTGEMTYKRAPFESGLVTLGYRVTNKAVTPPVSATAFVTIIACDLQDPLADCDGDGEPNGTDLAPTDPCVYAPGRQVKANVSDDWKALDCDGDGVINGTELTDGTSPADGCSFKAPSITLAPSAAWLLLDCDADGITNKVEGTQDFDGDGIPNCLDTDSDGDSISDKLETTVDTDKDGKPDYLDLDSDNDGILDSVENRVCTGTGILCDTDADGKPNFRDLDSDADQISDVIEANGSDYNKDGIADGNIDEKGIPTSANKGLTPPDTDRDGKLDPYDVDSDGDGILDYDEEYNEDADFPDCDHDGIINRLDPDECDIFSPQGISPNGDGKNDRLVFKGLFLRKIPNHLSIYNRWGTLVYEMESYDNTFTGTSLPDGTYYYILDFFGKKPTISNYLSVDRTIK